MPNQTAAIQRQTGVSVWRQIADRLRAQIADKTSFPDDKLPTEAELAGNYGVNRHTIRAALAALAAEGIVSSQQGRGTFIRRRERYTYPIGERTRFSAGLDGQASSTRTRIVSTGEEPAGETVSQALGIAPGAPVIRVEVTGEADGNPLTCSTHWFDAKRLPGIAEAVVATGSITKALRSLGVTDYVRKETIIDATHAAPGDLEKLGLAPGAIVFVNTAVNTDTDGTPLQYSRARFAADRVSLRVAS